jgi:hypothetical protein
MREGETSFLSACGISSHLSSRENVREIDGGKRTKGDVFFFERVSFFPSFFLSKFLSTFFLFLTTGRGKNISKSSVGRRMVSKRKTLRE